MVFLSDFSLFDLNTKIIKVQEKLSLEGKYDESMKLAEVFNTVNKLWDEMFEEAKEKEKAKFAMEKEEQL